ncbi:MAG TPA: Na(+)-translocating NADH-quinone reductase subunit C [Myxococcales bacterium]|nr:Na(+)-translocating NADH-quinone reductase subunit C [Myxococcales bacterium]HAN30338.1 Na(+)-translocating NADH-quinone reductase subunit C [Myxococcales bacterium]
MRSNSYIFAFAAAVCAVCGIVVAGSAVSLKDRQDANQRLDKQKKVLTVAGLMEVGEEITAQEVQKRFSENVEVQVVTLKSGEIAKDIDTATFDQQKAAKDTATSAQAPTNRAKVQRLPHNANVYLVKKDGQVKNYVFPVEGKGLWSTLYGYLALEKDLNTIAGLTFYQHGETPGLGGEVDNPKWKALWKGRKAFKDGKANIRVIKGQAGPVDSAPYEVDGLSGATLTCNGVTALLQFWLGEHGFGPYLTKVKG